ncbi:MAG: ABC transporter substrate-binding protein [Pseudomonadota bacterium]
MFKRIFLTVCLTVCLVMACWGCGDREDAPAPPVPRGYLYIGLAVPLEGPLQNLGGNMVRGAEIALDEANKNRGPEKRSFKLLLQDETQDHPADNRPATDPRVAATVGFTMERTLENARRSYAQPPLPLILPLLGGREIAAEGALFTLMPTEEDQARALAGFVAETLKAQAVLVIFEDSDFGRNTSRVFCQTLKEKSGVQAVEAPFPEEPEEMLKLAEQAAAQKPRAVFTAVHARPAVFLAQAFNRAGLKTNLLGTLTLALNDTAPILERLSLKTYLTLPFDPASQGEKALQFTKLYGEKHHRPPDWTAVLTHDAVSLAAQALDQAGETAADINLYLGKINSPATAFKGLAGDYYFLPDGQGVGPLYVLPAGPGLVDRLP